LRSNSRLSSNGRQRCSTGKQAARHLDHRRRTVARSEVLREALGIDRRRGHDDLQVGPPRQDLPQVPSRKSMFRLRSCASSMIMRVVGPQQRVALAFGEQDAVVISFTLAPGAGGPGTAP
jgi:hypothetical protein